jgi:hypothetical protein
MPSNAHRPHRVVHDARLPANLPAHEPSESIMSKFLCSALVAAALLSGLTSAIARPINGLAPNDEELGASSNQEGDRGFWQKLQRNGT